MRGGDGGVARQGTHALSLCRNLCVQARDNSALGGGAAVPEEVELTLINLSGVTIRPGGSGAVLRVAVATMAAP